MPLLLHANARNVIVVISVAILMVLTGFSSAFAATKTKLALNWKPEPQFGGFYAAEVGGFYRKNGLEVEILPGGAGTPVVQMIAAGKMDFGIVSADEVLMSRSNGSDVVALFAVYQKNPQAIMAHAERGFKKLEDVFNNQGTLALQKGLPYAMFLKQKYKNPKVRIVPYLGGIANFLADKNFSQQCFVSSEPIAARSQKVETQTFLVADEGFNPYTTVLVTRMEVLKKNPDLVKSMVESVRSGWRLYLDQPDATIKKMSELNKSMDLATFVAASSAEKPLIETEEAKKNGLGSMTKARWNELSTQLKELKLIKSTPKVDDLFISL